MYKTIIIDDEYLVCELIKRLIHWEDLNIIMDNCFEDGFLALDYILEYNPDIVITDIRMPGIDGLEIVKKVLEAGLNTKFIVLSGYKQFEYALKAVKYGVVDYLLKPVNEIELNDILAKICSQMEIANSRDLKLNDLEQKLEFSKYLNKCNLYEDSINLKQNYKTLEDLNNYYQTKFYEGLFQSFAVKLDNSKKNYFDYNSILQRIAEMIDTDINGFVYLEQVIINNILFNIINYTKDTSNFIKIYYRNLYDKIYSLLEIYQDIMISIGVGKSVQDVSNFSEIFSSSYDAICSRLTSGFNRVIFYEDFVNDKKCYPILNQQIFSELKELVCNYDNKKLEYWIRALTNKIIISNQTVGDKLREYSLLLNEFYKMINPRYQDNKVKNEISIIYECLSIQEINEYVISTIDYEYSKYIEINNLQYTKPIHDVKNYLLNHYWENVTLDLLAEQTHLSSGYLSVLFKKIEGVSFKKYLTELRIQKAKEFLKKREYKITEISNMVGYENYKHFYIQFRKIVGLSPNDYRKLY